MRTKIDFYQRLTLLLQGKRRSDIVVLAGDFEHKLVPSTPMNAMSPEIMDMVPIEQTMVNA